MREKISIVLLVLSFIGNIYYLFFKKENCEDKYNPPMTFQLVDEAEDLFEFVHQKDSTISFNSFVDERPEMRIYFENDSVAKGGVILYSGKEDLVYTFLGNKLRVYIPLN